MIAESTRLARVKEPVASTGAEDSLLQTSAAEPGIVEFVAALVASEATIITVPEVLATISVLTELTAGLVSAPSELTPASMDIIRTTVERGSESAPAELSPAIDIMEELTHQMVQ